MVVTERRYVYTSSTARSVVLTGRSTGKVNRTSQRVSVFVTMVVCNVYIVMSVVTGTAACRIFGIYDNGGW